MKKNILLILIGFLIIVLAIFYFNTVKSTPKLKLSTTINTLNNVKITNISGNTILVEQMATNAVSTASATVKAATYKIEVAADTVISFTKNTNFFLPKTKTSEKLTFSDLKIGYLTDIVTTSDHNVIFPKITATSILILDMSNTLAGNVVSISDKTMKFNVISLNIKTTDKNSNAPYKIKTYTVAITSNTELTSFNNGKEIPIKLSDIKAGNNAILLADQNTDVLKTNSINAVKIVIITTPPIIK